MSEVFVRGATQLNGVFSADSATLSFGRSVPALLVQSLNVSYVQNVTRLYEVGNNAGRRAANIYYVGGRTQGTLAISRVVGPSVILGEFYRTYGDVCNARVNNLQFSLGQPDCSRPGSTNQISYEARYCVLTQIGLSVAAQDMIINEQSQLMFSGLDYNGP